MRLLKKFIYTLIFASCSFGGTVFLSHSLDDVSNYEGFLDEEYVVGIYSLGYYDTIWEKRKVKYNINLGLELLGNYSFNFIGFYSMLNYNFSKSFFSSLYLGIDFFNHEYDLVNNAVYLPDSKGGSMYGLGFTYILSKRFPITFNYKIYNASEVQSDVWIDLLYEISSLSLGYKF